MDVIGAAWTVRNPSKVLFLQAVIIELNLNSCFLVCRLDTLKASCINFFFAQSQNHLVMSKATSNQNTNNNIQEHWPCHLTTKMFQWRSCIDIILLLNHCFKWFALIVQFNVDNIFKTFTVTTVWICVHEGLQVKPRWNRKMWSNHGGTQCDEYLHGQADKQNG